MKTSLLREVFENIKSVKIAVLGDFCLDAYFFIDNALSEISIETGLPTNAVRMQRYTLGGAGNLANNLISLGVKEVIAFGILGNDIYGREMINIMNKAGISTENLLIQEEHWATHVYCKPYLNDSELNRFDFGNFNVLQDYTADKLTGNLSAKINHCDAIVINQQVKSGIHTSFFKEKLNEMIKLFPDKIFITDIRDFNISYPGTYLKMNDIEAATRCGFNIPEERSVLHDEVCKAAEILFNTKRKPVFITCGSRGSVAIDSSGLVNIPGLMHPGRIDSVGAGDSYLAGAIASLAAGYNVEIAAETGSYVAGVTVRKLFQTGTATPEEVLNIANDPDYIYEPELAEDIRQAVYMADTEIEIINKWPDKLRISHAIFDHDGTISSLREGWELIMAPVMIKAILGKRYLSADKTLIQKVQDRVSELIDKTTGVQTLVQMAAMIDLIREFGFVPEHEILDINGYKKIYNDELLMLVNNRLKKLEQGELSIEDLTMKNAIPLIETFYNSGISLYLASGTDQEDVIHEARTLGYAHFFEGGIYGAVGDINKEAKKMVIEEILNSIGVSGNHHIITFGDGPVEIRETRKAGGRTVGIASDELKRFGLNEKKRTRLIKAGADIIIPDYTQLGRVLELLGV